MLKSIGMMIVAFLLGGCATAQHRVADNQSALGPQEPWQSVVLWDVAIAEERSFAVVRVPLPNPLPAVWRWDMNDHRRTYPVGKDTRVLRRSVWRAYVSGGSEETPRSYNAVLNPARTAMFVLVPGGEAAVRGLLRRNLVLVSGDACFVQTTKRDIVPLVGSDPLPPGFFGDHPSPVEPGMVSVMDMTTERGRHFLEGLRAGFPKLVSGRHSARDDVVAVSVLTAESDLSDRFISKGSVPVGATMLFGGPVNPVVALGLALGNREVFTGGICKETHEELGLKPETVSWRSE